MVGQVIVFARCLRAPWSAQEPEYIATCIQELPIPLDPSLTLTRMQHAAIMGNSGNKKLLTYAGFANPCNPQQPLTAPSYLEQG